MKNRLFTALMTTLLVASSAHAYETDEVRGYSYPHFHSPEKINDSESGPRPKKALSDGERLRKFNLALDALNIPHEESSDFSDYPADSIVARDCMHVMKRPCLISIMLVAHVRYHWW